MKIKQYNSDDSISRYIVSDAVAGDYIINADGTVLCLKCPHVILICPWSSSLAGKV
ncbi:hypothetical protein HDU92_000138 [Lobulomyces angularis]|nr:hypothetical protein HDU92_000138 [Lobulomyces angularis]